MATVSRVVNGTGKVKEETRQKVQQIIEDMAIILMLSQED